MQKKKRESSSRNSSIPEDIIYDIFSWLPVKSLYRFKCVSRLYNSLLSDVSFVDIHQSHSICRPDKTKFLAHSDERNLYTIDLKVKQKKASALRIEELGGISYDRFAYFKGLFCLWGLNMQLPVIYNPTTRKVTSLPCLNLVDKQNFCYCSIGFEPDKKKYKILMIIQFQFIPTRYWIFTLGSSESWREIKSAKHDLLTPLFDSGGVCIDGIIYFFCYYDHNICIVAFNVRTENFRIISLWEDIGYMTVILRFCNLIELEGKCTAVDHVVMNMEEPMNLWILERSEEWVKHTIALPLTLSFSKKCFVSCSFTITLHGELVLIAKSSFKPNRIFFYDLKKKSWRSEIEVMELEEKTEIIGIYSHVDCLLSCIYC